MSKTLKKVLIILVCIFAVLGICGFFLYQGIMKGRGPFKGIAEKLSESHIAGHAGNQEPYDMDHVEILESSPLQGKNICFWGSSVAYGKGAQGIVE